MRDYVLIGDPQSRPDTLDHPDGPSLQSPACESWPDIDGRINKADNDSVMDSPTATMSQTDTNTLNPPNPPLAHPAQRRTYNPSKGALTRSLRPCS